MDFKCVIVADNLLPIGVISNTVAILGCALSKRHPEIDGEDLRNKDDQLSPGLIQIPVPVLEADVAQLRDLKGRMEDDENLEVISFTDAAQQSPTYKDYRQKLENETAQELTFWGELCTGKD